MRSIGVKCFHHVSSIAAAGMFEKAANLDHPYFATRHESEKIVRNECKNAFRVYRSGMVIGDSKIGEMDKIDEPYYLHKLVEAGAITIICGRDKDMLAEAKNN